MSSSFAEKHDVFLSFRGEDTRSNFTSHLYTALLQKSITTFIDYKLIRGDYAWPTLSRAIDESVVSIVVFSENYASSTWCLKELVHILECRRKRGLVVIPVFYKVDPTHIRKLRGSYEKAFAKHERDPTLSNRKSHRQDVSRWKAALKEASNISGWDSRSYRDESQVIQNLVNDVLQKLHLRCPTELKGLVRIKSNFGKVESLVKKYRVIGIWGMGGIGKSTIAKTLFAKYFPHFDHVCFVANAKEYSLDKLFSELLREEVSASNVVGSTFDMRRLRRKKVLIVLDDVDCLDPLEYLCREYGDLDRDSRLIITTRDKQLLEGRVDWIYEVKKWKNTASLKLFCLEAFKKKHPPKGFESLSESAVEYAGGIPLALKVLGSHLRSRSINFWESTLRKLSMHPNEKIQNLLKVSYTELDDLEKNIFLDIAFFHKEQRKDHVIRILDACGFEATSGVDVLEDKALITISNRNIIQMHDLLLKMGLEIVRQESSGHPGSRSRLKDDEAREVIEQNEGTGAIQGIALDLSQIKGLILYADTFTKMKTLRFLKFYTSLGESASDTYLDLPTTLDPFSDKLRYIEWIGYPFESLPSPFCAKFLVEIHMPRSKVKQLWQGIQELDNLEGIDLRQCKQFEELPDLSKAPRLKWVILTGCESLQYLHPSVLSSDTLVTLILDRCTNLKRVKSEKHLKSLEKISVNGCLNLEEFAVSSDLIENLDLSNTGIQTLDTSIGSMYKLKWLNLEGLKLKHLLKELSCLTSLKVLKISDNGLVMDKQKIHVLFDGLRYLEILYLKDCSKLFELPDNISFLTQLRELRLDRSDVKRLPESVKNLHKLEILSLENCKELFCLPKFPSLIKYLRAINCTSLVSVSNLKTLATEMLGMTKRITFKNSCQLDGHSLKLIMESLHLTMLSAAYHNVLVRRSYGSYHSYNYTAVELCLPGGSVPEKIHYRSTKSSITIVLPPRSDLLGFIYSVVLSPAGGRKTYGTKINCKCHLPEEGIMETWLYSDIRELKSDHVYVWYDPLHCDSILKYHERPKVFFEFNVANDKGEVDGSICIEECGVGLVSVSEVESVLQELDFDSDKKKELMEGVELESKLGNQQRDWSEWSSSDSPTSLTSSSESDSEMVEPDLAEKGKYTHKETKTDSGINAVKHEGNKEAPIKSDATLHETVESHSDNENKFREKSITQSKVAVMVELETESTCKETQSTAKRHPKEESTESTQVDKIRLSERKRTESDVGLHQPTVSVNESNASKEDNSSEINCDWPDTNIQEVNYSEANEYLHAGEILVHHDIHDVNVAEEPNHENERENRGTDHCFRAEGEDGSDEDPFAELDSILLRSPKSSAKATSTTDVAVSEALHNLNFLLENSLDCILGDTELQQELLTTLEFIKEASQEKVSPNVAKLVEGITSSIDYLFKDFPSTQNVVEAHTSHLLQKQKLVQQVRDAKKQKELLNKEMRQYRFETERLGKKAEKLDEMIQLFTEQKKSVELKRAKLKETLEKCEGEKKKLKQEAKNKVTESKEIMLVIENSKASYDAALSKQQMLNDKWEGFRTAFADNCGTLVAHDS